MTNAISFGWVATFFLFCGFIAGGVYSYGAIKKVSLEREFQNCMDRAGASGESWKMRSQVAFCHDLYTATAGGRYGPQSDATIKLAMVRRPILDSRY